MSNLCTYSLLRLITGSALFILLCGPVYADHLNLAGSAFEIDVNANLVVDSTSGPVHIDWATVSEERKEDKPSGSGDDSFGQGAKEDSEVPSVVSGSIPPNKSDLKTFGVYLETTASNRFLHLFWHRVQDPSGTTNMDFEFNQSGTLSSNGITPVRTRGDMLIQYDLAQGGTNPLLFLSIWLTGAESPPATKNDCEASSSLPCWGKKINLSSTGAATGSINTTAISDANSDGLGPISARTFGEATIDFGAVASGTTNGGCVSFGSAYLKSRSSDSFNSALKDFITPIVKNVSNCASLKIVKQDDNQALLGGVEFKLFADNAPTGGTYNPSPGEDGNTALYSCTTAAAGTSKGACTIPGILAGTYWIVETAAPDGHDIAAPQAVTITAGGNEQTFTFTNPRKPASVIINKKDDTGAALAGAKFTLYDDKGVVGTFEPGTDTAVSPTKECTTNASGTCTISNILPPGNYCVDETVVPTGYTKAAAQCFTLALNQNRTLSDFVDNRQPASVIINKKDDTGAALDGAEFTLYDDKGTVGTFEPGTDTAVSPTKKCTTSSGTCTISNILPPGNYCVDETVVPTGYTKAAAQCFTLAFNQDRTLNDFINPRKTGAIKITKTRKHADATNPASDPHAGVEFTITGGKLAAAGTKVTTNDQGVACLSGLLLSSFADVGNYTVTETVPTNYVADGDVAKTVTVSQSGTCSDGNAATVSFSNTPLTNISVSATSLVTGGTKSSISCKLGETVVGSVALTGNPSLTLSNKAPGTYICTIVVDP